MTSSWFFIRQLIRTVGESSGKWDDNVARSVLWRYDHSNRPHIDRRNATHHDVSLKVVRVFTLNGGPSEYRCLFPRRQPQRWYYTLRNALLNSV